MKCTSLSRRSTTEVREPWRIKGRNLACSPKISPADKGDSGLGPLRKPAPFVIIWRALPSSSFPVSIPVSCARFVFFFVYLGLGSVVSSSRLVPYLREPIRGTGFLAGKNQPTRSLFARFLAHDACAQDRSRYADLSYLRLAVTLSWSWTISALINTLTSARPSMWSLAVTKLVRSCQARTWSL
jgi:hypothetical protein